jgi:hypothetical protein
MSARGVRPGRSPAHTLSFRSAGFAGMCATVVTLPGRDGVSHSSTSASNAAATLGASPPTNSCASASSRSGSTTLAIRTGQDPGTLDLPGLASASSLSIAIPTSRVWAIRRRATTRLLWSICPCA